MSRKENKFSHVSFEEAAISFFRLNGTKNRLDFGNETVITFKKIEEIRQQFNEKIDQQIQNQLNKK